MVQRVAIARSHSTDQLVALLLTEVTVVSKHTLKRSESNSHYAPKSTTETTKLINGFFKIYCFILFL